MAAEKKAIDPFEHVVDSNHIPIFETAGIEIHGLEFNGIPLKFMLLMGISATIVALSLIWLGKKMANGEPPTGRLWNLLESLLFFVRDKIVRPGVGEHDANRYLPYLTTLFLFIFAMNLIGMFPFLGSPTASIMVTAALALVSFVIIHAAGLEGNHGVAGYLKTFIPPIHIEGGAAMQFLGKGITVGIAALEYATAFIRVTVLAVRLFANMLAGHTVLFMILFFIALVDNPAYQIEIAKGKDWLFYLVMPFSVLLVTALSLLELFIAGLQEFIFTFLTAVFIGLAKHPALARNSERGSENENNDPTKPFSLETTMLLRFPNMLLLAFMVMLAMATPALADATAGTGAGIGMGLAIIGIGVGIGLIGYAALSGIARQPEQAGAIQGAMFILAGLVEGAGIIALVLCLSLLFL